MPTPPRRRLRAPTGDGAALIDPPLSEAAKLIEYNQGSLAQFDQRSGFASGFRQSARMRTLVVLARSAGNDPFTVTDDQPLILSGHQPELFHPGVWFKNFVLSSVARHAGGRATNLRIDSDAAPSPTIRVPSGSVAQPRIVDVPYDASSAELPWEARHILDDETFRTFPDRVRRAFEPLVRSTAMRHGLLLDRLWPHVVAAADRQHRWSEQIIEDATRGGLLPSDFPAELLAARTNLGACLSQGRHQLESELGLTTDECSLGGVCSDEFFLQFFARLVAEPKELHEVYNAALAQFRLANGIRSRRHPMPDLERSEDWLELPFWIWTLNNPGRQRLFARRIGHRVQLTNHQGLALLWPPRDGSTAREWESTLTSAWIALRPRALITTMYARLVLSDLFIHGIGGAKYDEATDEIIRRFFGIEPPQYITATATFRLPLDRPQVTIEDVREARQKLRDVRYRPENFLRDPLTKQVPGLREQLHSLADEKREYVRTHGLRRCAQQVFARLDTINREMHQLLKPVEQELHAQDAQRQAELRRADLLGSREFSFCLFPADELPARLLALSEISA